MRIAYVCADPGIPVFGAKGASVHVQEVLRVLLRRGATVDLYCARTGGLPPPDLAAVRVICLPSPASADVAEREQATMANNAEILAHLRRAGRVDLVYERYALWGGAGVAFAAELGVPGILEVNAPLIDEHATYRTLIHHDAARRHLADALAGATAVVCVSEPVAGWVRRHGARPGSTVVVPNGVNTTRIRPAAGARSGPFTVGFVGTLKPWHGVDVLLEAAARLPGVRVRIVGDGPQREQLAVMADRLGSAGRTVFTGAVAPGEIPAQLNALDVAVASYPPVPAGGHYFSPLKLYEYLAAGLPVVASAIGQATEVITPGVDGLLVPAGDAAALTDALRDLQASPSLRAALGARARRTAVTRHSWDRAVDATLAAAGIGGATGRAA